MSRLSRFAWPLAAALALASTGCTIVVADFFLPKEGVREAVYPVERQKSVGFETSDGVSLVADVYRPRTTGTG